MKLKKELENTGPGKKECLQCKRYLPDDYEDELCPRCQDINLFAEVRDYIRANDVREMDVAKHFNIPLNKVRSWIREGRIVYKTSDGKTISGVYCHVCGKKIEFGNICADCRKMQQLQVVAKQYGENKQAGEMHFIGRLEEPQEE